MTWTQIVLALGVYLNAALYLTMVFVAGLVTKNDLAWKLAAVSAGLCYFAYVIQIVFPEHRHFANSVVATSIIAGIVAGGALLWWS